MQQRSLQLEYIDLGPDYYSREEYWDCLKKLGRIGRFLGGDRATFQEMEKLKHCPSSILDVGCGGGTFTVKLAQRYPNAKVVGIDTSEEAITFAKEQAKHFGLKNLYFEHRQQKELTESANSYDVVMATLVCHHMKDEEIIAFLKKAAEVSKEAVIINDLHRHYLALALFAAISPIFFRNRLIMHDGLLSIRRAFTKNDWEQYLKSAGFHPSTWRIKWKWAFRWIITITS